MSRAESDGGPGERDFERTVRGARVCFRAGARAELPRLMAELGWRRLALVGTPGRRAQLEALAEQLGAAAVAVLPTARQHVPVELVDGTLAALADLRPDAVLAVGGGSAIGLAKALALRTSVAVAAVPTTYSGSEMTAIHGLTRGGAKVTGRDERARPRLVVYDPELTWGLPLAVSVGSLFNALAHAAEALYAPGVEGAVADAAAYAVGAIAGALRKLPADPRHPAARQEALYGAHLAGACLDAAAMGLHHKLAHVLGGLGLPHAETHTVLLPHVLAYNRAAAPAAMARIAQALGAEDAAAGVAELARAVGAPTRLADLGLGAADVAAAVRAATANPYANPGPVEPEGLTALLEDALAGRPPRAPDAA